LVTGGAGFIGSELVRQLVAQGHRVLVVDNLVNGKRANLEGVPGDWELAAEDILDLDAMRRLVSQADVVLHLACLGVRHSIHHPRENHEVNATGTLGLLTVAREAGVKRFVHVSSSEVYGTAETVPMTEEHPLRPTTVYGASKLAGEAYARAFGTTYGLPTVVVRPFNTYGPRSHHEGDSGEVIPRFMLSLMAGRPAVIFGDGSQTRDFTHVSDTAAGILAAGFEDAALGRTLNLGSGSETSVRELADVIAGVLGRGSPEIVHEERRPGDVQRHLASPDLAARLIGYKAAIPLADGLAGLREWYATLGEPVEQLLRRATTRNWLTE
jgi:UDP-glucose 4-epimerase